jgi:hypothetical protein
MQSPKHAFSGRRLIILHKYLPDPGLFEIIILIGFHKITSAVPENRRRDYLQPFDLTGVHFYFTHIPLPLSHFYPFNPLLCKHSASSSIIFLHLPTQCTIREIFDPPDARALPYETNHIRSNMPDS